MPLVVTYHPRFHDLCKIIRKYCIYLYAEKQVKQVPDTCARVSFLIKLHAPAPGLVASSESSPFRHRPNRTQK